MAYLLIDDRASTHPKLLAISHGAFRLWFSGNCYCQQHLTNGVIPAGAIASLPGYSEARVAELFSPHRPGANPLWKRNSEGDVEVHDYLQWNQSKEEISHRRAGKAERMRQWREKRNGPRDEPRDEPRDALRNTPRDTPQTHGEEPPVDAPRDNAVNHKYNLNLSVAKATGGRAAPIISKRNTRVLNEADAIQLPAVLIPEFQAVIAASLGGETDGYERLLAWAHEVSDELVAEFGGVPAAFLEDPFKAWKQRLAQDWGIARRTAPASCRHGHKPPCVDDIECTRRYRDESRKRAETEGA